MPPTNNTQLRANQHQQAPLNKQQSRVVESPLQQQVQIPHPALIKMMTENHQKALSFLDQKQNTGNKIKNVWVYNMDAELEKISALLEQYPYVAVDTEYPGCIYQDRMPGPRDPPNYQYNFVKQNIDKTKIIQLGITLSDEQGQLPQPISTWQFNFDFNEEVEPKEASSFDLLLNSGIDFQLLKCHGISPGYFGEKIIQSGLVMNSNLTWICFAGSFDMAYLLSIIMNEKMPTQKTVFQKYMDLFFPKLMDIKSFVRLKIYQDGGLGKIADFMGVPREGTMHQAGSDSMLTIQTFFAMFNCMLKEKDRQEYKEIFDEFNQDVYGFSNDQAYRNLAMSFSNEPIKNNQQSQRHQVSYDNYHHFDQMLPPQQHQFVQEPRFMMAGAAPTTDHYLLQQLLMNPQQNQFPNQQFQNQHYYSPQQQLMWMQQNNPDFQQFNN